MRVLVIDDDAELCEEMAELLRDEGYQVVGECDPKKGQSLIETNTFDIVIVDYKMPGISGIEVLKKVKEKNAGTKVFVVTGRSFIDRLLKEENVSHLVSGIISKPFDHKTLLGAIKQHNARNKKE